MNDESKTLDWIQAFRGVAALLVVLAHARYYLFNTNQWDLAEQIFRPGAMGVDLFFIVSGFIMVYSTRASDGSFKYSVDFAIKRFARIWPIYAVVTMTWVWTVNDLSSQPKTHNSVEAVIKSLLFIPADPSQPLYFGVALPLGWTLEFEMYFYLVFGICLLFNRFRWIALSIWLLSTVVFIPLLKGNLSFDVMKLQPYSLGYLQIVTNPLILEFLAGALIALLYLTPSFRIKSRQLSHGLIMFGISLPLWYAYTGIGDIHGPTKWGWPLVLMVLIISTTSKTIEIRVPQSFVWLGKISFSLYLTHTLSQYHLTRLLSGLGLESHTHSWGHVFITTVFALTVAPIAHHYLENRMSHAFRKWLFRLVDRTNSTNIDLTPAQPLHKQ
jgi:exopolysaccharide production protein ExoZ